MIFTWAMIFTSEQGITENYCRIVILTKYYDTPSLIARFMGPKWGPSGADRTQVGPMLASWTLLSGIMSLDHNKSNTIGLLRRSSKSSLIFRHGYVISSAIITLLSHNPISSLTHWGQEMHICVSNLTIIGSDNGLLPGQRQAIIWTNAGLLSVGSVGTNFSEILIEIYIFSFKKMHVNISSTKWLPFCLSLSAENTAWMSNHISHKSMVCEYISMPLSLRPH